MKNRTLVSLILALALLLPVASWGQWPGHLRSQQHLYLNLDPDGTNTDRDVFVYFGLAASDTTTNLKFDQASDQFEFTNDLNVTGNVTPTGNFVGDLLLARIAGSTYSTVQDLQNLFHSAGWATGGGITDDTDGTITVAAGTGFIRATDSAVAEILFTDWAAESGANVNLTDASINYVYVEYNSGTPRIIATVSERTDYNTNILLGIIDREGTTLHINSVDIHVVKDHANNMIRRLKETVPWAWVSGGIISEVGTRNIASTTGNFWRGLKEFSISAFDSSAAGRFSYWYNDGSWQEVTTQSAIHQTNYNDFGTGLATLSNNRYGVHWVYLETDDDVDVIYGQGDYTLTQAQDAGAPASLPRKITTHGFLVGRIIIKKSASVFTQIESAFDTTFSGSVATDHGNLTGLAADDHTQYVPVDGSRDLTGGAWGIGADDTTQAILQVYGGTGSLPGTVRIHTGADDDGVNNYFQLASTTGLIIDLVSESVASDVLFNLSNPGAAEMNLTVEGVITSTEKLAVIDGGTLVSGTANTVAIFQRSAASGSNAGIDIVSGTDAQAEIHFGDTDGSSVASITYSNADGEMEFGIGSNVTAYKFFADGTGDDEFQVPNDSIGDGEIDWNGLTADNTFTISNIAPQLNFIDTTASASDFMILTDGDFTYLQELADTNGDLLTLDLTNHRIGIDAPSPENELTIRTDGAESAGLQLETYSTTAGHRNLIFGERSNSDTMGTDTATVDGMLLFEILVRGVDSGPASDNGGRIKFVQNGASGSKIPTDITFETSSSSSGLRIVMVLGEDGIVEFPATGGGVIVNDNCILPSDSEATGTTSGNIRVDDGNQELDVYFTTGGAFRRITTSASPRIEVNRNINDASGFPTFAGLGPILQGQNGFTQNDWDTVTFPADATQFYIISAYDEEAYFDAVGAFTARYFLNGSFVGVESSTPTYSDFTLVHIDLIRDASNEIVGRDITTSLLPAGAANKLRTEDDTFAVLKGNQRVLIDIPSFSLTKNGGTLVSIEWKIKGFYIKRPLSEWVQ